MHTVTFNAELQVDDNEWWVYIPGCTLTVASATSHTQHHYQYMQYCSTITIYSERELHEGYNTVEKY